MKKYLLLSFLMIVSALTVCSCDDESGSDAPQSRYPAQLIGTWEEFREDGSTDEVFWYTFKADGTGSFWATFDGEADHYGVRRLKWNAQGNILHIDYLGASSNSYADFIYEVSGNTLTTNCEGDILVFHRVK